MLLTEYRGTRFFCSPFAAHRGHSRSADTQGKGHAMPEQPRRTPPYRPGDPPPSENECAGVDNDNGPCRSFKPMEWPWETHCRKCGYVHG
jgi:hypothetical protein